MSKLMDEPDYKNIYEQLKDQLLSMQEEYHVK